MEKNSTGTPAVSLFDETAWFAPIETGKRERNHLGSRSIGTYRPSGSA
jgi:hypothetical protein